MKRLLSSDHFSLERTLIEAWAERGQAPRRAKLGGVASGGAIKSKPKQPGDGSEALPSGGRNSKFDFKGQKRSNATHESTTDPEARLY